MLEIFYLGNVGGSLKWPLRMLPLGTQMCEAPNILSGFLSTSWHFSSLHLSSLYILVSSGPYT